jgi:TolB-like protein/DNA-binding winged helix-turn-helix (wHTH) protein/tetratricopeptide (TPR) repeat protein
MFCMVDSTRASPIRMVQPADDRAPRAVRFGPFQLDLRTRELYRNGTRLRLQGMPVEVLVALVERAGDLVTRQELRARLWPDDTFVDYENSMNNAVARLRDALRDSADDPTYIETLPKRGYRFIAPVTPVASSPAVSESVAVPVSAVAPAGDAAPAAASPTEVASGGGAAPHEVRRPVPVVAMAVAILAVIAAGLWLSLADRSPLSGAGASTGRVMLAVLPFDNLSGSPEHDYLSDGFTEELITELARADADRLGVIARTTAMQYKGSPKDVAQIGRELAVDYVLEGSVRHQGGDLRITAQLIRVSDQTHVWADTFDRRAVDLLDVERDVSAAVSREVRLLVGAPDAPSRERRRPHPDAYAAYLRARFHHAQATVPGIELAISAYRDALAVDPGYALAHAGLARAYIFGVRIRPLEALRLADESARAALALDPDLPEAQLAVAMTKLYYEWDWSGSEREFRRVIEQDSGSADAHFYYSHLLAALGRHDEALAAVRRAQALDPHSTLIGHYVGRHLYMARRYDEALESLRRTLELDPNYGWTHVFLFLTLEKLNRLDEALGHRQKYLTLIGRDPEEAARLGTRYASAGYPAVLEQWIDMTRGYFDRSGHLTSAEIVHLQAAAGRRDEALDWLDRAVADHTRDLIYLNVDPGYDSLRHEPRYLAHVARLGLQSAQR